MVTVIGLLRVRNGRQRFMNANRVIIQEPLERAIHLLVGFVCVLKLWQFTRE
jgi:hypothetical protein